MRQQLLVDLHLFTLQGIDSSFHIQALHKATGAD